MATLSDPPLVGVHREIDGDALGNGAWENLPDGRQVWRLSIHSLDSIGLRMFFSEFAAGNGRVWIYGGNSSDADGPYSGAGIFDNGQFWSATINGDSAIIEYEPEAGAPRDGLPPFQVKKISHQVRPIEGGALDAAVAAQLSPAAVLAGLSGGRGPLDAITPPDPAAGCNLDVNCYPEWADSAKMVAHILFEKSGGQFACSGALVATRNNTFKPYFLTAGHCISSEAEARSVEAFWQYQTSSCNATRPADKGSAKSGVGGNLMVASAFSNGDYSLLRLRDVPNGVLFAGWDAGDPGPGSRLVGIHHPAGSYKRISFGHRVADQSFQVEGDTTKAEDFYIALITEGIEQPGSSGGPAFSSPGIIVGELSFAAVSQNICALRPQPTGFGRFSSAYAAMRPFLEDLPFTVVLPSTRLVEFRGANGEITAPVSQTVNVTTQSANAVAYNVRADDLWIKLSATTGSVAAARPGTFNIAIDPKTLTRPDVYTGTVTISSLAAPPQFVNVRVDMRVDRSDVTVTATPNPVTQQDADASGARWFFKIRLEESAGVATRLTSVKINGREYAANINDWFGSGRIAAKGSIEASLRSANLVAPTVQYFELSGVDDSGQTWYRTLTVPFQ